MAENYNKKSKVRCFHPGDKIYVKSHTQSAPKWIPAVLRERSNDVMISETEDGRVLRRHRDHVRRRHAEPFDIQEGVSQDVPAAILEPSEPGETVTGAPSTDEEREDIAAAQPARATPSSDKEPIAYLSLCVHDLNIVPLQSHNHSLQAFTCTE